MAGYGVRWRRDTALRMSRRPRWKSVRATADDAPQIPMRPATALRALPKWCRGATALHSASAGFDAAIFLRTGALSMTPRSTSGRKPIDNPEVAPRPPQTVAHALRFPESYRRGATVM